MKHRPIIFALCAFAIVAVGIVLVTPNRALAISPSPTNRGVTFDVTCSTTAAGVTIDDGASTVPWNQLYCENNSATTIFWGWASAGTLDTSKAPCISTTIASCLHTDFSIDASRASGLACKVSSGTATLKCNAGGP